MSETRARAVPAAAAHLRRAGATASIIAVARLRAARRPLSRGRELPGACRTPCADVRAGATIAG